ncbi:hypothetical protein BGZ83_004151 [Gryganskiella cystojenkinii]|nr:hypothetical protein BGZ83_004151 [Gryganskiella cystojenkinii]
MHVPSTQSPALLYQIKGIVNLLRPYVVRQQRLQHGERQKERQKERLWDRADKYMRQQGSPTSSSGLWRVDALSDNDGDMEDEDELDEDDSQMDTTDRLLCSKAMSKLDMDGDVDLDHGGSIGFSTSRKHSSRRPDGRMDADEAEVALESLLSGLSLLEANQKQQQIQSSPSVTASQRSDVTDGNLADNELDPRNERDVEDALPDILEQVAHVLQAIKLNEVGE